MKHIFAVCGITCILFATSVGHVFASACVGLPSIGDTALSNCTLTVAGVTGVDQSGNIETSTVNTATLTLNEGAAVTINAGGTLAAGSIVLSGGTIAIASTSQIKPNTPIYVPDADADGFAADFSTLYVATASGRRRFSLMRSSSTVDCGDSTYNTSNSCCVSGTYYADSDGDGYGSGAPITMCPAAGYVANNTDCNDASASIKTKLATGGTISYSGGYIIHKFTSSGTFTLTCGGATTVEYLVVAGGGGGGASLTTWGGGGGGGAGGMLTGSLSLSQGTGYSATVGSGGSGWYANAGQAGNNGSNSTFYTVTATGGGGGAAGSQPPSPPYYCKTGGSGGGAGYHNAGWGYPVWCVGIAGQGNHGGQDSGSGNEGAGGGGAGGVGGYSTGSGAGGTGGAGLSSSITGSSITYSAGGEGGSYQSTGAVHGAANSGNGGNGAYAQSEASGDGGSGVVIVRYLSP